MPPQDAPRAGAVLAGMHSRLNEEHTQGGVVEVVVVVEEEEGERGNEEEEHERRDDSDSASASNVRERPRRSAPRPVAGDTKERKNGPRGGGGVRSCGGLAAAR